jgi:hypothetical protein
LARADLERLERIKEPRSFEVEAAAELARPHLDWWHTEPEFRAIGANYAERGAVTDEYLDAMRSLWHDPQPA